jgi:hypothetical protein
MKSEAFVSTQVGVRTDASIRASRTQRAAQCAHLRLYVQLQVEQERCVGVEARIKEIANTREHYGYYRVHVLLGREGHTVHR